MSPVFVIFCIIAFLIPMVLCFYYKHKVKEQSTELEALKEKEEQTASELARSMMYCVRNEEKVWQEALSNANYIDSPPDEWWKKLVVEFSERKVILESFKMTDTYKGLIEGSLAYASMGYWCEVQQEYSKEGHLLLKPTLVKTSTKPYNWGLPAEWCLPTYEVEIEVVDGASRLWLCWFTADVPQTSLTDFINAQTRNIDFNAHCMEYIDD